MKLVGAMTTLTELDQYLQKKHTEATESTDKKSTIIAEALSYAQSQLDLAKAPDGAAGDELAPLEALKIVINQHVDALKALESGDSTQNVDTPANEPDEATVAKKDDEVKLTRYHGSLDRAEKEYRDLEKYITKQSESVRKILGEEERSKSSYQAALVVINATTSFSNEILATIPGKDKDGQYGSTKKRRNKTHKAQFALIDQLKASVDQLMSGMETFKTTATQGLEGITLTEGAASKLAAEEAAAKLAAEEAAAKLAAEEAAAKLAAEEAAAKLAAEEAAAKLAAEEAAAKLAAEEAAAKLAAEEAAAKLAAEEAAAKLAAEEAAAKPTIQKTATRATPKIKVEEELIEPAPVLKQPEVINLEKALEILNGFVFTEQSEIQDEFKRLTTQLSNMKGKEADNILLKVAKVAAGLFNDPQVTLDQAKSTAAELRGSSRPGLQLLGGVLLGLAVAVAAALASSALGILVIPASVTALASVPTASVTAGVTGLLGAIGLYKGRRDKSNDPVVTAFTDVTNKLPATYEERSSLLMS